MNVVEPLLAIDDWYLYQSGAAAMSLNVLENDSFNSGALNDPATLAVSRWCRSPRPIREVA